MRTRESIATFDRIRLERVCTLILTRKGRSLMYTIRWKNELTGEWHYYPREWAKSYDAYAFMAGSDWEWPPELYYRLERTAAA